GYIFNPVCFYYVFDRDEKAICAIVEVRNTFMELKPYFLEHNCWDGRYFGKSMQKYFYVSPFIAHDAFFHFQLGIPNQALDIKINDRIEGQLVLKTALNGKKAPLNDQNLLFFFITMPFITLQIIFSIHWQALRLYLKGLPYFKKDDHLTLQRDLYKP
ncbi:MAG: DUF1365 family protein, partial [Cytophagales bacterium]